MRSDEVRLYADCGEDYIGDRSKFSFVYDWYESNDQVWGGINVDQETCETKFGGRFRSRTSDTQTFYASCDLSGTFDQVEVVSASTNVKESTFRGFNGDHMVWAYGCYVPDPDQGCVDWRQQTTFEVVVDYDSDDDGIYNQNDACPDEHGTGSDGCPTTSTSPSEPIQDPESEPVDGTGDGDRELTGLDRAVINAVTGFWNWLTGLV